MIFSKFHPHPHLFHLIFTRTTNILQMLFSSLNFESRPFKILTLLEVASSIDLERHYQNFFLTPSSRLARLQFRISTKLGDIFYFSHFSFSFEKITDPHLSPISKPHHLFFKIALLHISESRICHSFLYLVSSFLSFFFNFSLTPCPNRERSVCLCLCLSLLAPFNALHSFSLFLLPSAPRQALQPRSRLPTRQFCSFNATLWRPDQDSSVAVTFWSSRIRAAEAISSVGFRF